MNDRKIAANGGSDCGIVEELLSAFFDEELNETADSYVRHHLDDCAGCSTRLEEIKVAVMAINSLPREATPEEDLWPGVAERAGMVVGVADDQGSRWSQRPWLVAAAIAVFFVGVGGTGMFLLAAPSHSDGVVVGVPLDQGDLVPRPALAPRLPRPPRPPRPSGPAPVSPELAARAVTELIRAINDANADVRAMAIRALGERESETAAGAIARALLTDPDVEVRRAAAWALGEIASPGAVSPLGQAVREDADIEVRQMAIRALAEIEDPNSVQTLVSVLDHADTEIRTMAVWALGEIESPAAVAGLSMVLFNDVDAEVRQKAAWALGEIQSPAAHDALLKALDSDTDAEVRRMSAWALGEIVATSESAIFAMTASFRMETNAEVRQMIVWAFGEIESPLAMDALVEAMRDADAEVRAMAMWAIGEIGN